MENDVPDAIPKKYFRKSGPNEEDTTKHCFFCEKMSTSEPLHEASTLRVDSRVRKCPLILQDEWLLAKVSAGDMLAQDAKYHPKCLVSLYNNATAVQDKGEKDSTDKVSHSIALAELLNYIEEAKISEGVAPVLKLADLVSLYSTQLKQLGVEQHERLYSTIAFPRPCSS